MQRRSRRIERQSRRRTDERRELRLKLLTFGPVVIQSERSVRTTSATSSSPIEGGEKAKKLLRLPRVGFSMACFPRVDTVRPFRSMHPTVRCDRHATVRVCNQNAGDASVSYTRKGVGGTLVAMKCAIPTCRQPRLPIPLSDLPEKFRAIGRRYTTEFSQ